MLSKETRLFAYGIKLFLGVQDLASLGVNVQRARPADCPCRRRGDPNRDAPQQARAGHKIGRFTVEQVADLVEDKLADLALRRLRRDAQMSGDADLDAHVRLRR